MGAKIARFSEKEKAEEREPSSALRLRCSAVDLCTDARTKDSQVGAVLEVEHRSSSSFSSSSDSSNPIVLVLVLFFLFFFFLLLGQAIGVCSCT